MMKLILFALSLRIRYLQVKIVTAIFLFLFLLIQACDGNGTFQHSELTFRQYEDLRIQTKRAEGFGTVKGSVPVELFPDTKVILK